MNVICLQDDAFYALIDEVVARLKEKQGITRDKWISAEAAMKMPRITSKSTMGYQSNLLHKDVDDALSAVIGG